MPKTEKLLRAEEALDAKRVELEPLLREIKELNARVTELNRQYNLAEEPYFLAFRAAKEEQKMTLTAWLLDSDGKRAHRFSLKDSGFSHHGDSRAWVRRMYVSADVGWQWTLDTTNPYSRIDLELLARLPEHQVLQLLPDPLDKWCAIADTVLESQGFILTDMRNE